MLAVWSATDAELGPAAMSDPFKCIQSLKNGKEKATGLLIPDTLGIQQYPLTGSENSQHKG